jgi:hypothetical protein
MTEPKCKSKQRIYYNVSIPHNDLLSVGGSPTAAKFSEARDEPLFNGKPCDWNMSVVRFSIPTSYIPIQIFPVQEDLANPLNPNKSIYSITLTYLGVDYIQHLEWETQVKDIAVPPPPTGFNGRDLQYNPQNFIYYSLYSYEHFCTLINTAIATAFALILPLLPAPPAGTNYQAPYFTYDGTTRLFSYFTDATFLNTTVNNIQLWSNIFMNDNFDNAFDQEYYGFQILPSGKNVRFVIRDRGITKKYEDATAVDGFIYKQTQEYTTISSMESFTSLILRSVSLPINNEALTLQPQRGQRNGSGIGSGSESIISDFEIDIGAGNYLKPAIHYIPTAEYRRITMNGQTPIQRIDIEILWKDNFDNLYPLLIPAHQIATIKILFEEN